jgi:hypothetical protein
MGDVRVRAHPQQEHTKRFQRQCQGGSCFELTFLATARIVYDVAAERKFALQTIIQSALESTLTTLQQVQQFIGLHHDEMTPVVKVDWEHVAVSKGCHVCGHQTLEDRHGGGLRAISGFQVQQT